MTEDQKTQFVEKFVLAMLQKPSFTQEDRPRFEAKASEVLDVTGEEAVLPISKENVLKFVEKLLSKASIPQKQIGNLITAARKAVWFSSTPLSEGIATYNEVIKLIFGKPVVNDLFMTAAFRKPEPVNCWDLFCIIPLA